MAIKYTLPLLYMSVAIYLTSSFTVANSIHGCGGFVEASPSLIRSRKSTDAKFDYSHITVELQTVDGLVKERTQCAPNGYYFIPVYDKGSFVIKIKGPEGWSWDPDKVPVLVDHKGCNSNEDINFRFTGFTLSGRVVGAVGGDSCSVKNGGPSNVAVELLSPNGDLISSVHTSSTGVYSFTNIIPGKYILRASHPDLKVEAKGSTEVELGFANGVVDDIFFVPGYDIRGSVVAQIRIMKAGTGESSIIVIILLPQVMASLANLVGCGIQLVGNPILGVHIYLYSADVPEVDCPQGSGKAPGGKKALCHAASDADGLFVFKSIPCGFYELIPYYKGENTVFDVSPSLMSVSVEHHHLSIPQKFQVTGFSVGGRVIDNNGMGVDGARVFVDGQERFVTDNDGNYKLDQVTSKRYTIEAKKEHYKFNILKDFLVLPNMASIADIEAISFDVCGMVHIAATSSKAKVALTHGPENVKPQVRQTDESGNFCFEVPPGEYRLSALAASPESASELLFLPSHIDVVVKSPVLNVEFSQAQVSLRGTVSCKETCGSSVSVTLVKSAGKSKGTTKTFSLTGESSEFLFQNVFPGKYKLEVKHTSESMFGEDNWCWEQNSVDVDVGVEDVGGIVFVQKGYWVKLISSHVVDAYMIHPDGSRLNLKIEKGAQQICVEHPGVHDLHFINSCIFFGSSSAKVDTANPSPIYLKGEKYLLSGEIHVDLSSESDGDELPEDIIVDVLDNEGTMLGGTTARLIPGRDEKKSAAAFEYSIWATLGERLTFVPRDSRNNGRRATLFYPKKLLVSVTNDGCQAPIPPFSGRLGLYIKGSVSPPLPGVYIRIIAEGDSHNAELKKDDLALEVTTGTDGVFVGGPLYDDISYSINAFKPGYHLKQTGPYSFSCQKLGQIAVRIYSEEDSKEPFPSVLLSLSGEDGYRNNSISGVGGVFLFDNLFPGSFYLRPLLKEYAFSPSAEAIELDSGESRGVIFRASHVAFSAMGVVTVLSGQPKEGIAIEARAELKGLYEETITDSSGSFRLRGLLPDTTYTIKVVEKDDLSNNKIERASPESVSVKVGSEDIKGLDFVVFEKPEMTILSGHVEGNRIRELRSHLRVEIKSASDPSRTVSSFPLPLSLYFQVKDLPRDKHLVQLRSGLPSSSLKFESDVIEVDLEKDAQVHVGPLGYRFEEDHLKQDLTPAPVFPLIVGFLVIGVFISFPRLKDLYEANVGISGSALTMKKEVRKPVVRKKTY
ncbi:hypothetical protein RJ641_030634 [Dillenia turbinata]|uniref:Uncharacterized protein n=1 Tax=Dillenia turbinata TaxID=194707 RepID=A0AAN8ZNR7_9MAGN